MNYRYMGRILAIVFMVNSILNICFGSEFYKTLDVYRNSIANDLLNILFGITVFMISFTKNNRLKLASIGFYLLFTYSFIANAFMMRNTVIVVIELVFAAITIAVFIFNLINISREINVRKIKGGVFSSILVLLLGIVFIGRSVGLLATIAGDNNRIVEFGTSIADLVICSIWIVFSILLLFKTRIGFAGIVPILLQASMLFISLVFYLVINSLVNDKEIPYIDVLFVGVMSLLVIIPFIIVLKNNNLTIASA
jgi:hypothetical protein